jgi:hypothetical protein
MTRIKTISEIGSLYEKVLDTQQKLVQEKTQAPIKETFPIAADKKPDVKKLQERGSEKKAFVFKDSGPAGKDGKSNVAEINDPKYKKNTGVEKFSISLEKTGSKKINNFMSKSIFDKLFEDVMGDDALDLGIKAGPEGAAGDESSDLDLSTGGDTVSITLDKDVAKKLHEVLMAALEQGEAEGESEAEGEAEADLGGEVSDEDNEEKKEDKEADEDNEELAGEAIDAEEIGTPVSGKVRGGEPTSPKGTANVVKSTVSSLAKHGKGGDGKVTDKCGNDGDKGHALVGSGIKGGAPTSPKGRNNVVSGVVKGGGKGDQTLFQAN